MWKLEIIWCYKANNSTSHFLSVLRSLLFRGETQHKTLFLSKTDLLSSSQTCRKHQIRDLNQTSNKEPTGSKEIEEKNASNLSMVEKDKLKPSLPESDRWSGGTCSNACMHVQVGAPAATARRHPGRNLRGHSSLARESQRKRVRVRTRSKALTGCCSAPDGRSDRRADRLPYLSDSTIVILLSYHKGQSSFRRNEGAAAAPWTETSASEIRNRRLGYSLRRSIFNYE